MNEPLINILIRHTAGRREELKRTLASCFAQSYQKIRCIICTDSKEAADDVHVFRYIVDHIKVTPTGVPFHWNFYCNNLKERVTDGWFLYCDDDDYLVNPHCLANLAPHLDNHTVGVICQFNRGARAKPQYRGGVEIAVHNNGYPYVKPDAIVRGKIGGSCIVLHHSQKDIAHWDGQRAADYRFIKAVSEQIPLKWVPVVVVQAGNKGRRGK